MSISDKINRMRHRHGFGVHSPLGFALVKNALWLPRGYAFYGETDIDDYPLPKRERNRWRRLLRAVAYLGLGSAVAPKDCPRHLDGVLSLAGCTLRRLSHAECKTVSTLARSTDMLVDLAGTCPEEEVAAFLALPGKVAVRKLTSATQPESIPGDLILLFRDRYIALSRPGMARTLYTF